MKKSDSQENGMYNSSVLFLHLLSLRCVLALPVCLPPEMCPPKCSPFLQSLTMSVFFPEKTPVSYSKYLESDKLIEIQPVHFLVEI